ncbi:Gp19/Gp15/Gp42 family protein [uncultured Corynebacterium sp.]|uniref:Gp19/Gp15/Gp42 family protein n=1 Tax=uncultured Corynebacterium sp. TaxID=159447 RepID=UPI002597A151|nr:Gp19/Gp15/Gp42 family protein [uncultured Corynebacterium sp.]
MFVVEPEFVAERIPRPLDADELKRLRVLVGDAVDEIEIAFARAGRDFQSEVELVPWLRVAARRVVLEMVSAAVLVGGNAGVRSVSSTTGPQSDSITYADVDSVSFGGVRLTDQQRLDLGLCFPGGARGRFPRPVRWPEVSPWPRR